MVLEGLLDTATHLLQIALELLQVPRTPKPISRKTLIDTENVMIYVDGLPLSPGLKCFGTTMIANSASIWKSNNDA